MADKTKFISTKTIVKADFANKIFGGLANSDEATFLDPSDPLVAGHVHDGMNLDGHAQKVDLEDHVIGELDGDRIQDASITDDKLAFGSNPVSLLGQTNYLELIPKSPGFPTTASKTFTFPPAPEDISLKRIIFTQISDELRDSSIAMFISSITVNAGPNLLNGIIPAAMFTHDRGTRLTTPMFNIPVSSGEVVELIIESLAGQGAFGFFAWTYVPNPDGQTQTDAILGMPSIGLILSATAASASITVNSVPLTPGDTVDFVTGFGDVVTLLGVSGVRVSGNNDFSVDNPGDTAAMAAEIEAALADQNNSFSGAVNETTTSILGSTLSWDAAGGGGSIANLNTFSTTSGDLSVSDYSGGVDATATITLSSPTQDLELKNPFVQVLFGDSGPEGLLLQRAATIEEIRINGVNIIEGKINASFLGVEDQLLVPNLSQIVSPGDVIEIDIKHSLLENAGILVGWPARIL